MSKIVKATVLAIKEKFLCCIGVVWQIGFIPSPVLKFNHSQLKMWKLRITFFCDFGRQKISVRGEDR
jgi:hypothetical protein